jgi:hypothetical protein
VTGKKGKRPVKPAEPPRGIAFPSVCATDDCDAHTMLVHPGRAPFGAGLFLEAGWVAMSESGERTILYLCPKCIAQTIAEVDAEMASTRQSVKSQVSG